MTSDNVTEVESVRAAEPQSARGVDDQLIDELVGRAQADGLQLTGEAAARSLSRCTARRRSSSASSVCTRRSVWARSRRKTAVSGAVHGRARSARATRSAAGQRLQVPSGVSSLV
ncbi:hypothetical protein ABZT48_41860 [Streptomyces avermitilis]|uniref:hypothetical protein n=1 Tax=Streptomyces avermitilis TaxID=33903 RepID=UPI0033A8DA1A